MVITVALDRCNDDPRPFIERASPTHPALIDTGHRLTELYNVINVPTILWIDEEGRIVRPADCQFGTDTFTQFHGKQSGPYLDMIRRWVRDGEEAMTPEEARAQQLAPTQETQLARAERALAWRLHERGDAAAAARHFERAGELSPRDWTIRRGSLPIQGEDPFGPKFFELAGAGAPEYPMEQVTKTRDPDFEPPG